MFAAAVHLIYKPAAGQAAQNALQLPEFVIHFVRALTVCITSFVWRWRIAGATDDMF